MKMGIIVAYLYIHIFQRYNYIYNGDVLKKEVGPLNKNEC